jgi:hypothetical protein
MVVSPEEEKKRWKGRLAKEKKKNKGKNDFSPIFHTDFMILRAWNPSYK